MTAYEKIIQLLKPLDIPVVRSIYKGDSQSYCIISVYKQIEFNTFDNVAKNELAMLKVTYWRTPKEKDLTSTIKFLLQGSGFRFMYKTNLIDGEMIGNALDFQVLLKVED
ncbi:hypothetical protein KGR20_17315 [Cytobacillus oceanisediminis]|uniref:hypothetical protein n=1 Tax=Cytobacillus oceanisediminis TaxID=665099 RepID=UPI001CCEFB4F|nr:hypothetical protein [Cytobacillus oceanisediminis]MBZ9535945.1 hypothetical protein [Cytobacillus oceanisediminis]